MKNSIKGNFFKNLNTFWQRVLKPAFPVKSGVSILFLCLIIFGAGSALSCKAKLIAPDSDYVSAISSGVLGRKEPLVIEFTRSQDTSKPLGKVITLSPSVQGEVSWRDEFTLVFTPSQSYKAGQQYFVSVNLEDIPSFNFDFITAVPIFDFRLAPLQINGNNDVLVYGTVIVDDDAENSKIEQTVTSKELGKPEWLHENGEHRFSFKTVNNTARSVDVVWDGSLLGADGKGTETITIPGKEIFQMIDIRFDGGVIEVSFSSPLKANQDLRGFVTLAGNTNIRYSLEGNTVKIFGGDGGNIPAGAELLIQDLEDVNGKRLASPVQFMIPDKWEVPEIRFAGNGVILPTSQGANLVVETKNLSGLLIEAFQIYENNMLQFLQVNNLTGTRELDRVGQPVWTHAYNFSWSSADQNKWIRRGVDMSELSKKFPGGMFHVRISFRPRHVQYVCSENHGDFSNLEFPDDSFVSFSTTGERTFWDNYYRLPNYSWREWNRYRNDPCHPAFYVMGEKSVTQGRNVYVSDLGLLAKRSLDGSWALSAANLITAQPAPAVEFKIFNYQMRVLHQGRTDKDGMAVIPSLAEMGDGSRLVVYAENNLGKAYLKINDSLALATSHFDVAGGKPSSGIRGLIYGERDVWRPGDEMFLTFLLSDPENTLPPNHPVSFELEDPRGRSTVSQTFTSSIDGFYPIAVSTPSSAPTGNWTARVRVGGNVFSKNIKVETIMPNRLKMNLDFADEDVIKSGPRQTLLESEWLYGAPASELKADIEVSFADKDTTFPAFMGFSFRDPSRAVSSERKNIWEGTLDTEGKASFTMNLNPGASVPGKVTARFMTRVFEQSGVFSSEQISREYSPYKRYVGVRLPKGDEMRGMLLTDIDHNAEIVLVDEDGKLVSDNTELDCAIYKISWRWWWEKGGGESAEFASILSRNPIARARVNTSGGKASWSFKINYPDWGRYLVLVRDSSGGHAAAQIVYIDWPGWAGRAQGEQGSSSMLTLTPGKTSYNVGEKVQVTFPSNKDASAFVVVEKGGKIIENKWLRCEDGTTRFEFNAAPSMFPNVYVHVTLLQPHLQTQNDLPIRLYGIVPVTIDDPRITLRPVIAAPENWQAESKVSFTVSEASGRPMAYTVAVVDEGLLGLTRFNIPNPRSTFYAKEASFLKSWDLFQEVIGAYSGRLETLLAIGGGDDTTADTNKETQRFKPVVRFFGPYEIKSGESKTETFDLPPYIGALRVMILAASSSGEVQADKPQRAYGTAEKSVKVTSDLMVFATLPRVLSVGDEVEVPVHVNSFAGGNRNVRVGLSVPNAAVQGESVQNISFNGSGEKLIRFKVKAPDNPQSLQFTVTAESQGLKPAKHVGCALHRDPCNKIRLRSYSRGRHMEWRA